MSKFCTPTRTKNPEKSSSERIIISLYSQIQLMILFGIHIQHPAYTMNENVNEPILLLKKQRDFLKTVALKVHNN